jgi:hypothetical protein
MKAKTFDQFLLIGAMVGILLLALVFDVLIKLLMDGGSLLGGMDNLLIWLFPLMQLLLMIGFVGLVWLMLSNQGYSRLICITYMVVGLITLYSTSLLYIIPVPESYYVLFDYLSPGSFLYQASGAVAAIGLFSLAVWKPAEADEVEAEAILEEESNQKDEIEKESADPASSSNA